MKSSSSVMDWTKRNFSTGARWMAELIGLAKLSPTMSHWKRLSKK